MEGDKARTGGARVLVSSDGRWVRPVMCADCFFAEWPTGGVAPRDRASAEEKARMAVAGYCKRLAPYVTASQTWAHWQIVYRDTSGCGSGVPL